MRPQKQLFRHDPANGVYGDCHRTAIAIVLDMDAADAPHFMDKCPDNSPAPEATEAVERWLNDRGITQINVLYPNALSPADVIQSVSVMNPGLAWILGGKSRTGVNHSVVIKDGDMYDPSLTDAGIIGPCDDGYYWVTFFGAAEAKVAA
jgi:hypothetical protein